ncbi:hypothetical protein ACFLUR_03590 [Chloroflexota bacterium]
MRIKLKELTEAVNNPVSFRRAMRNPPDSSFVPRGYFSALRESAFYFHKNDEDRIEAEQCLERKLDYFTSTSRSTVLKKQNIRDQFDWYIREYFASNFVTFQWQLNVVFNISRSELSNLELSGQICRMDINPAGGYMIWQFRGSNYSGWMQDVQMPIIQQEMAKSLNCSPLDINIGIISFAENFIESHKFSSQEIQEAEDEIIQLYLQLSN